MLPTALVVMLTVWAVSTVAMPLLYPEKRFLWQTLFNFISAFSFLVWLIIFSGV